MQKTSKELATKAGMKEMLSHALVVRSGRVVALVMPHGRDPCC